MSQPRAISVSSLISLIFFGSFFAAFTARGLLPADAGEFQVVAPLLGVAHPPGFPLYTLLGKLFVSLVPFGTPAYRLNLLSAALAAATLVFVSKTVRALTGSLAAGLLAALALGVSTTFWSQATTANVRMLVALCAAIGLYTLAVLTKTQWARARQPGADAAPPSPDLGVLTAFMLALGVGISHHASLIFMGTVFDLYLGLLYARRRGAKPASPPPAESGGRLRRWARWLLPAAAYGAPFLFVLYLPLRGAAGAFLAPPHLATLPGFFEHILATGFEGDFFYFAHWRDLPDRLAILGDILTFQFNPWLLAGMAWGGLAALRRDWRLGALLAASFAVHAFVAITYRAPQTVEYMLPAYVVLAVALGYGYHGLGVRGKGLAQPAGRELRITNYVLRFTPSLLRLTLLLATLLLFARNLPSYRRLAHDDSTRAYAEGVLTAAPEGALVLASWHWATPMWYLQEVEGLRPDVEVEYVFPQGESLARNWAERLAANVGQRPVIVTSFYPLEFDRTGYRFAPLGPAWLAVGEPIMAPPYALTPRRAPFGGRWQLAGYLLETREARPGETIPVVAAWVTPATPEDINFFVQLLGPDGALYGQMDVSHRAARAAPGEWLIDRYPITVRPDAPPGDYALVAGAYLADGRRLQTGESGRDSYQLATIRVLPAAEPPVTRHPILRPAPGTRLTGYDYDRTLPDSIRLYLHWRLGEAAQAATVWVGGSPFTELALPAGPGYLTTAVELPPGAANVQAVIGPPRVPGLVDWGAYALPDPPAEARYVPLGGAMALTGVRVEREAGGEVRVDLELVSARALTEDDIVKVDLIGPGYAWRAESNSVPAGGAIPTLKWVAGSVIHDRHRLVIPPEAGPGTARLELAAYDHFTERALPILDPRLAILGPTVPLGEIETGE